VWYAVFTKDAESATSAIKKDRFSMLVLDRLFRSLLVFMTLIWVIFLGFESSKRYEKRSSFLDNIHLVRGACLTKERDKLGGWAKIVAWDGDEYLENRRRNKLMMEACEHYDVKNKDFFPNGLKIYYFDFVKTVLIEFSIFIILSYVVFVFFIFGLRYTLTGKILARKQRG